MLGESRIQAAQRSAPHLLVARNGRAGTTRVRVGPVTIGGEEFVVAAGPCAVETEEQVRAAAQVVAQAGARLLRGGAFKPRTSPYSFQGLGFEGLRLLSAAGRENGLPVVTEVLQRLRERIDELDEALVRLLVERARLAAVIGRTKRESGLPIYAPDREDAVLGHVTSLAAGPFGPEEIARVFRTVMAETRRAEERE